VIADSTLLRVVLSLAVVYAAAGACAWLISDRLIFLPPSPGYRDGPGILAVPTRDGERIAAVYRPNPSARYTLLLSHGNAEDLGSVTPLLAGLSSLGFSVFAYDYRGYGRSEGTPSESRVYADIDAAYEYLVRELQVGPERIVAYGRSLGAGAAVDLAAHRRLGGLVLESPFLSAFRVMTRVPLFPFDKFRNAAKIGSVSCPVLIMHGEDDEIVPFWHGRRLFELAPEPKTFVAVPGAHHNDFVEVAGPRYAQALRDFEARLRGH
jgi:alpha-beta hydrolase superfamily lysophospholipase